MARPGIVRICTLLLVLFTLLLAGAARAQEPIKIGFSESLTGGLASSGKAHLLSKQIWVEEINAKGGLLGRPVKLVYYDDQTNAATVPGIYAKLIDIDKVDLLMGAATNLIVAAMPQIMERKRMVMVLLALGSNAEFKYPRYFQSAPFGPDPKGVLSNAFFEVAKSLNPAPKTVALVGADAEFANNVLVGARENAKRFGFQVVYDRSYPPSTVDYSPVVRAVQAANPDVVLLASYPPDSVGMVRAATEVGLKAQLFGGAMVGMQYASLITQLSEKLNRVVNYHFFVPSSRMNFAGIEAFLANIKRAPRTPASTRSASINRPLPMRPCRCWSRPCRRPEASMTKSSPPISTPMRSIRLSARSNSTSSANGRMRASSWCNFKTSPETGSTNS
ncbi:MAG: amino acid ABC transporter substrate-binding protein [Xanthobacteraceae bacterium]|nr:amino acid ABC transporter substrate-binding protein [Xanthobacteraceae bacterium]